MQKTINHSKALRYMIGDVSTRSKKTIEKHIYVYVGNYINLEKLDACVRVQHTINIHIKFFTL